LAKASSGGKQGGMPRKQHSSENGETFRERVALAMEEMDLRLSHKQEEDSPSIDIDLVSNWQYPI